MEEVVELFEVVDDKVETAVTEVVIVAVVVVVVEFDVVVEELEAELLVEVVEVDDVVEELEVERLVEVVEVDDGAPDDEVDDDLLVLVVDEDVVEVVLEGAYQSTPLSLSVDRFTWDAVVAPYDSLRREPDVVVTSEYASLFTKVI
jgi:hypothetical protein